MDKNTFSFWDRLIYSIFSVTVGIFLGVMSCWLLSFYYENIHGFGDFAVACMLGIASTTLTSILLPSVSARVLAFLI